jgi:hypothetical protein
VESPTVLLVRGELVHRYPRLMVYATPGKLNGQITVPDPDPGKQLGPDFVLRLDDRTTAFAFNLTDDQVRGKPGFYFVFSEPITGPRFNFDEPSPNHKPINIWSDLSWDDVSHPQGFAIAGADLAVQPLNPQGAKWNTDASNAARIAFARPFQVAYHADELLAPGA